MINITQNKFFEFLILFYLYIKRDLFIIIVNCKIIYYYSIEKVNSILKVALIIFLISLFIESTQIIIYLVFPNDRRFFEINDLIL